ncbi:MAG: single-stranded DNA-binding protein [Armatimonadota bacterium]
MNLAIIIGRLATVPTIRYTPDGAAIAQFAIAPEVDGKGLIPVMAYERNAEFAAEYLTVGQLIGVEGSIRIRRPKDVKGGAYMVIDAKTVEAIEQTE